MAADPPRLGHEPDAFVGRAAELVELAGALEVPGWVTLKGAAGIGKTRLATAAARRWTSAHDRQVWFCDLTQVRTLHAMLFEVASLLDVAVESGDPATRIGEALGGRGRVLVVLDNLEQLVEHAPVLATWCDLAPSLSILATSRVSLGIDEERVIDVDALDEVSAVALLVARASDRGVDLHGHPRVAELVASLDGLPLAIELAAGRLGVLSLEDVLERSGLGLLRAGSLGRHGTLRRALDGSWELLDGPQRGALTQLAVFRGGFTLEAAEDVLQLEERSPLDVIDELVDRSLVRVKDGRLDLLVSVRQYAAERLDQPDLVQGRHGDFYARFGTDAELASLDVHGGSARRTRLAADVANLVHACRLALARDDGTTAVRTLRAAWAVARTQGPYGMLRRLASALVESASLSSATHADAALVLGEALRLEGEPDLAREPLEQARKSYEDAGEWQKESRARRYLGMAHVDLAQHDHADAHFEAALASHGSVDDAERAATLSALGNSLGQRGRHVEAKSCYLRAIEMQRRLGDRRGEAIALSNLGIIHGDLGEMDEALACHTAALEMHRTAGARRYQVMCLGNLGLLWKRLGEPDKSRAHYEAALEVQKELGDPRYEGICLGNLGRLAAQQSRTTEARDLYERALVAHRRANNPRSEGIVLSNLATLLAQQGERTKALEASHRAYELFQRVHHTWGAATALGNIAGLQVMLGELQEARPRLLEALELHRQLGDRRGEARVLGNIGVVMFRLGDSGSAREHYDRALAISRDVGDRMSTGIWQLRMAELVAAIPDEALPILADAEAHFRHLDAVGQLALALATRAHVYALAGDSRAEAELGAASRIAPPDAPEALERIALVRDLLDD
jgi:predicted ATPase/predicted negative regulator of RcsB-dependent stress response